MDILSWVDWGFLEAFFGEHGKLITAAIALVCAFLGLSGAVFKYLHARILEKERAAARRHVQTLFDDLQNARARVRDQQHALDEKEEDLERKNNQIDLREQKLRAVRSAFKGKEHDLWCIHPAKMPTDYLIKIADQRQKPIITVANLKGGVGKTTLTTNLASFFDKAGLRVLLIDVDYQGSLSNMLLSADGVLDVPSDVNKLLDVGSNFATFMSSARQFGSVLCNSSIISSKYDFATCENRLMIEYLLQETPDDGRYRLANVLLDERVSSTFDIAFIDAPPRLTAGTINALCTSTHLLVPTIYDNLSAEAVGTFLAGVSVLKNRLNPGIDLLGVVGTLTNRQGNLNPREIRARNNTIEQVSTSWGFNHYFFERYIPRKEAIAEAAGEQLAYFGDKTVKEWFDELGQEIADRLIINIPSDGEFRITTDPRRQGADR